MTVKREIRLNGFIHLARFWLLLLRFKEINLSDLGALFLFAALTDWDKKHRTYKCIVRSDKEIAIFFGLSPSTINRKRRKLTMLSLLNQGKEYPTFPFLDLFEKGAPKLIGKVNTNAILHSSFANMEEFVANLQRKNAKMQLSEYKATGSFKSSFKDNLVSFDKKREYSEYSTGDLIRDFESFKKG